MRLKILENTSAFTESGSKQDGKVREIFPRHRQWYTKAQLHMELAKWFCAKLISYTNQINDKTTFNGVVLLCDFIIVYRWLWIFWLKMMLARSAGVCGTAQETFLTDCQQMSRSHRSVYHRRRVEDAEENNTSFSEASRQSHLPHGLFSYKTSYLCCIVMCLLRGLKVCQLIVGIFEWGLKMELTLLYITLIKM